WFRVIDTNKGYSRCRKQSTPVLRYSGVVVADLTLVEEFLNTLDARTFRRHGEKHATTDHLTSVEALSAWLEARDLVAAGRQLGPSDLAAAVALRAALREALTEADDDEDATRALADFPLRLEPDASGRLRIAATSGVPGLDRIVETVATNVAGGGWHRMK